MITHTLVTTSKKQLDNLSNHQCQIELKNDKLFMIVNNQALGSMGPQDPHK